MSFIESEQKVLINTRAGGVYIPPARLRQMQQTITDKASKEYQRITWEALKKSINGLINKVNTSNIKNIVFELFNENLIRGRGLFARSIMKAQSASLPFTPVYAALVAIINTKLPQIGELVLTRLIVQFRKAYRRNDKTTCLATTSFIAHLCNHLVSHEIVALQVLVLLLEHPTSDSVEVAVGFMRECGAHLADVSPKANNDVFDRFRAILHEANVEKRVQYMIEVLFQVRKDKFKDNPPIPSELDLVKEDDQITHHISIDDELDVEETLGIFNFDPNYLENEEKYKEIKSQILGDDSEESGEESGSESSDDNENDEDEEELAKKMEIHDLTNTNLITLRKTIYLTIKSSLDFEECCHKLMKLNIQEGQETELCNMIIECCSQERTYEKFFGLIGERLAKINSVWAKAFEQCFIQYYETIHRYETNRLRNVSKYFGHLLASDAISWEVFSVIKLTEDDTTSSSRIFVKILFEELSGTLGIPKLKTRLNDDTMSIYFQGLFPKDHPRNIRFAINYFTSIGLGQLTEGLREYLANAQKQILAAKRKREDISSSSDSDSSSDSSSSSSSGSSDS
ncbi:17424_t:CDS:2 [Funneliformis geosporum]|uniref:19855_t:CDS:1 n=1 Tax=Funneliformis geosporum TaxID=1117311 RepID=A0A9W4SIT2_9GLOM|nr:19855_t:CDS:2 [Funneliformis geosporum]CAI2192753.1 17424_t:CDS:2 [Funneliformis geosporum]